MTLENSGLSNKLSLEHRLNQGQFWCKNFKFILHFKIDKLKQFKNVIEYKITQLKSCND